MKTATQKLFFLFFCSLYFLVNASAQVNNCPGVFASITNDPVINLCPGTSVTLQAQGSGGTFQWQRQTVAGGPFVDIGGATSASHQTNTLGAYRVVVGNSTCSDTSSIVNIVRVTLEGGTLSGITSPVCMGLNAGLISGTEVPGTAWGFITFTWQVNVNNTGWTTIADAHDLNYFAGAVNASTSYRRIASDNCGNTAVSNVFTVFPYPAMIAGSIAPGSQTVTSSQMPAPLTSASAATGGSGSLSYQWQSSVVEHHSYTDIAGATSATYAPGMLNRTTYFKRIATDNNCSTVKESNTAVVIISNAVLSAGGVVTSSSCVFPGGQPAVLESNPAPSGGTPPYQITWQMSTDNVNFTTIPGATGATYQPASISQPTWFRKRVTDANGNVAHSQAERLSLVTTPLQPGSIMATSDIACLGVTPGMIAGTASASGFGEKLSYQWQYRTASSSNWIDITDAIRENVVPMPISEKTWFRRLAMDICGMNSRSAASNEVAIDVKPELMAGDIEPATQTVARNGIPRPLVSSSSPSGGTGSYTITWQRAGLAVGPWTDIANSNTLSYQPPALDSTTYFRRSVQDNNCLAVRYSYVVEVVVAKASDLYAGKLVGSTCVFAGNRPGMVRTGEPGVSGGTPPYTFQWQKRVGTAPFADIAGATTETHHPDIITQTTQYRRRMMDALGQTAYSDTITINYINTPLMAGTIRATAAFVCPGSATGLIAGVTSMSGYGEAAMYQWQMSTNGTTWTDIAGAMREYYQPGTLTQKTWFRRGASDMCSGVRRWVYSNVVSIDIAPPVAFKAGLVDGPFITCAGTAPGLIRSVLDACGTGAAQYQWEMNTGSGWVLISGATNASYSPGAISANTQYRRRATDGCGRSGYSNVVEIYVYPPIEPGVIGMEMQTVCPNATPAAIQLTTECHYTDGTVSYQWQRANSLTGPWTDIPGATGTSYQPAGANSNMYYRLQVSSTTCSFRAYTNVASVLVGTGCRTTAPDETTTLYPNPISNSTFLIKRKTEGKVSVLVHNLDGTPVPVSMKSISPEMLRVEFNRIPSKGMYAVTVLDDRGTYTLKLLVQ